MRIQQPEQNKPTITDIRVMAASLGFDVRGGGEHDGTLDMDKRGNSTLGGTWSNNQAGFDDAYGYLVRYQHTLEQINASRSQHKEKKRR